MPAEHQERGADREPEPPALAARQSSWNSLLPCLGLLPFRLRGLLEQERPEHEAVDVGAHEAAVGVLRRADDRLAAHVERRVHQHRAAGEALERLDQVVVVAVGLRA